MYLGIDVGGTKTLIAVLDDKGNIKEQAKFLTPKDYALFLQELEAEIAKFETKDFKACGLAFPGRIDRVRGVGLNCGNLPWENVPVADDCRQFLHCPVVLENDANLAGLSEAHLLKEYRKVLYVTISTGIGDALVVDGKLDPNLVDSEAGHSVLEHNGKLATWESFASGSAIHAKYGLRASEITDPQIWYVIARNIALGLIHLIAITTPDVIVLGGGVGGHLDKYKERLVEELKIFETPMTPVPPIRQAARPETAVIFGCYDLVKERYGTPR
jgi:predicted NBD/HSP70 family sugar kinase